MKRYITGMDSNALSKRDNIVRAIRFDRPEYIPMTFHINEACWGHYPAEFLEELMAEHSFLFPAAKRKQARPELEQQVPERVGRPHVDPWGCKWETAMDGIVGTVTEHPLADWGAFESFIMPDPAVTDGKVGVDWGEISSSIEKAKAAGEFTVGGLIHGHTFQRMVDLRGYEDLLFDMFDGHADLQRLIEMVERFNAEIVQRYVDLGVDMMCYAEDLGMQSGPMVSPEMFKKYIGPVYERLMEPAREAGCIIHMHSDGCVRELVDELVRDGVEAVNIQDLVNGIDWIRDNLGGRVCVDLDIDRQEVTVHGSPGDIEKLIREEVTKLGSPQGGLMLIYGLYPGVPRENVRALADAMEKYAFHFSG
ncbi:methylcobalamin:coenzyme M methyltransferase [Anaerohalosphaera lusitana]|uniref:Methylcobalamin:coenzyme M methyltransferase n=1 Tax=Anaerohalosphaera lusitana TaxID=1936003 RepID=A0A1U9NJL5_9BACT|nr:uroporphyrinogen decarboxylase family protein [Anaerohalosphaera lusitana]AQT67997.1 methylcobalamin:coenzyme M methyltransferase [Anaerohalosphaera lusitana]